MKGGERAAKRRGLYDAMEHETDSRAEQRFREPARAQGKLTALAAVKIIERDIEHLPDSGRKQLIEMAQECLHGNKGGKQEMTNKAARIRASGKTKAYRGYINSLGSSRSSRIKPKQKS